MTTEWQPIETAPKDGTRILLCLDCLEVCIGSWNSTALDGPRWEDDSLESMPFILEPTHLMPLPEHPTA